MYICKEYEFTNDFSINTDYTMDLLHLLMFIVVANVVPSIGMSPVMQNLALSLSAFCLGCDLELCITWYDCTITVHGSISGEANLFSNITTTMDGALFSLEKETQAHGFRKFISVNKQENLICLYMDFLHLNAGDFRVYIDGYFQLKPGQQVLCCWPKRC